MRCALRRALFLLAVATLAWTRAVGAGPAGAAPGEGGAPREPLRVVVPDPDNLQYLSFWVALGAGYFEAEGFDVALSSPSFPAGVAELLRKEQAPVAVLPPPVYLELISDRYPARIVANLLANDGINLIVRRSIAEERRLSAGAPLADRLRGLRGLRVGVAPGPVKRLRAVFAAEGLDADQEIVLHVAPGKDQNDLFGAGRVDALFAHTPYLEKALLDQDAVMLVNASAGDVPTLAGLQIHALVVTAAFADARPASVQALVRAVARAQRLIHADVPAASAAAQRALPALEPRLVDAIVRLYEPAVPAGPEVSVAGLSRAHALFPARKPLPQLEDAELAAYVDARFAAQAGRDLRDAAPPPAAAAGASFLTRAAVVGGIALALAVAAALVALARRRAGRAGR